jgi:hypothetical protein
MARPRLREKPYKARLDTNGVWTVEGSLPKNWLGSPRFGGVAIAEISSGTVEF